MTNEEIWLYRKAGSGGGTEVVPNPEDEATDDLEKVKIGDTTYAIPASGCGYTLVSNRAVDTGVKWIDGTSPIYAVYLPNGINSSGFTWNTTVGLIVRGITFTYNTKGMNEYDTVDITGELGTQNNLDGTFRAINLDSTRATPTLLYVV